MKGIVILGFMICVVALVVVIGVIMVIIVLRMRKAARKQLSKTQASSSIDNAAGKNANLGHQIPFVVLQEATNSFDENLVIGVGGFGKVYKGTLCDGTDVAVKRGNPTSHQGIKEFRNEIELSGLHHIHIVSLVGYCDEGNEMILIYEYMGESNPPEPYRFGKAHHLS